MKPNSKAKKENSRQKAKVKKSGASGSIQTQAEDTLQHSDLLWRTIFSAANDAIMILDDKYNIIVANRKASQIYGLTEQELTGINLRDLRSPAVKDLAQSQMEDAIQHDGMMWETTHQRKDGSPFPVEVSTKQILLGDQRKFVHMIRDISQRKQAEVARRSAEGYLRTVLNNAPITIFAIDREGIFRLSEGKGLERAGLKPGENVGVSALDLYDSLKVTLSDGQVITGRQVIERVSAGESLTGITELNNAIYENQFVPLLDSSDQVAGLVGVATDITDRKQAEEILRESESRHRLAIEHSSIILAQTDRDLRYRWIVNPHPDFDPKHAIGMRDVELADNEGTRQLMQMKQQVIDTEKGLRMDIVFPLSDGLRTYDVLAEPLRDAAGAVVGVTTSALDITERKQTEKALKDVYQKLELILNTSPLPILGADATGRITSWNRAAENMFGWTEQEAIGKICPTVPEEFIQDYLEMIQRAMQHDPTFGLVRYRRKRSGTRLLCSISAMPQINTEGKAIGVTLIVEDITERAKAEEKLKKAHEQLRNMTTRLAEVEENERRNIARELHDRVGQSLTALNIDLNIIRDQVSKESAQKVGLRIDDSIHLVEEVVMHIRNVMTDLHPPVLDDYGLTAALRWFADRFSKRTEIPVRVEENWKSGTRLSSHLEMVLFRIAQEALNNAALHADARKVVVRLDLNDGIIRMTVEDDGRGFDPAAAMGAGSRSGWGLQIMRERIEALGGRFQLESAAGRGTRIIAEINPGTGFPK